MNNPTDRMIFALRSTIILIVFTFTIAGCRQEEAPVPPTSTQALPPLESDPVQVSRETQPRITPTTLILAPTFTPVPTLTPRPTGTPPSTTAIVLQNGADFGTNRNPLTGEVIANPENLKRRPIAVKISNSPARWVRPQSGLGQADIIFEHVTEGLITRFTALIYGHTPENLGPIRSARLIDLEIPLMYDAALAYSGSSIGVSRKLFASEFSSRILRTNETGYYRTGEAKPFEHTLYAETDGLWQAVDRRDENREPRFNGMLTFSSVPPPNGEKADEVFLDYRKWTEIEWRHINGRYWRWADGEEHVDANTGEQLNAANVIVIFAEHTLDRSICEYQVGSTCHSYSAHIDLSGTGEAVLFRNGYGYDVEWRRTSSSDMLTFYDAAGNPMPLNIGNSWFQIIPNSYPDPIQVSP